jgi:Leucine-rich repeat (LRR) protein
MDCSSAENDRSFRTDNLRRAIGVKFSRIVIKNSETLDKIPTRAFGDHHAEEYIFKNNTELFVIQKGAFGRNANPRKIVIENCGLQHFPFSDLHKFTNLQVIILRQNFLTVIPHSAFSIPGGALTFIDLDTNSINDIGTKAFEKLEELETINLYDNEIADIQEDVFSFKNDIKLLNISHNLITSVDRHAFRKYNGWK